MAYFKVATHQPNKMLRTSNSGPTRMVPKSTVAGLMFLVTWSGQGLLAQESDVLFDRSTSMLAAPGNGRRVHLPVTLTESLPPSQPPPDPRPDWVGTDGRPATVLWFETH